MQERDFIRKLQLRAKEQERLLSSMPYPKIFLYVSRWLSNHPWKYLIPLAFILTLTIRMLIGKSYTDFILRLFSRL